MKKVQVLLSTYNGEKFIKEQIESLKLQKGVEISILVRDDGSTDGTIDLLTKWQQENVLKFYQGENLKPAMSFMDLIKNSPEADYYAFCDQDDYWEEDKLLKAIDKIDEYYDQPALYFSKAQLVDEKLSPITSKGYPKKKLTFGQSLIKNNATGCTIVFNRKLLEIVKTYVPKNIPMHDYWVYQICLAINGFVIYDENSYIKYRQHASNVVGGRRKILKEYSNKFEMLVTKSKIRSKMAIEIKYGFYDLMPNSNKVIIDKVINYSKSLHDKWSLLVDKDIRPLKRIDNFLFTMAVIFNAF